MAKKSKSKQATRKRPRASEKRTERRFIPQGSAGGNLVKGLGGLSAAVLGAGAFGMFKAESFAADDHLKNIPSYVVAAGAVLLGVTIWLGTSSEPPVRVGSPGIAIEKGDVRRMPWWAVSKIRFDEAALAVLVVGKDEANVDWTLKLGLKNHPEAIAALMKEAGERIPRRIDIDDSVQERFPADGGGGERLELEPLQVVGKRCAATGKTISYEPDARVCHRCERVYLKTDVPKKCKCGNNLGGRAEASEAEDDLSEDEGAESGRVSSREAAVAEEAEG